MGPVVRPKRAYRMRLTELDHDEEQTVTEVFQGWLDQLACTASALGFALGGKLFL